MELDRNQWIRKYEPLIDDSGNLISYDVLEDISFITSQDETKVWSEIWDFDSEQPLLVPGCVLDENGGLCWYICKNSWSDDDAEIVQWIED